MTATAGHNSLAGDKLKSLVERIENLETEKKALAEDIKEVYSEAKAIGFDTKVMRAVIRERKKDPADRDEFDSLFDLYMSVFG